MRLAGPEDRALLGSNPSAAVGDGDIDRGIWQSGAPVPKKFFFDVLVQKAINPSSFAITQLWRKSSPLTRPVCHLAISPGLLFVSLRITRACAVGYKHFVGFANWLTQALACSS